MTLTENDLAMLREMGRGFNEPELDNFIAFAPQALQSWRSDDLCASQWG
jgi:hypothetical protein